MDGGLSIERDFQPLSTPELVKELNIQEEQKKEVEMLADGFKKEKYEKKRSLLKVVVTQPRRVAAIQMAKRVA